MRGDPLRSSLGDPQVVPLEIIVPIMRSFVEKHDAQYQGSSKFGGNFYFTGLQLLAQESGVDIRKVRAYINGETRIMGLRHAEALLMAMGLQHMLGNGEIPVEKNPNWSWRKYNRWLASPPSV